MASRLDQLVTARLDEIREVFRSGLSQLTGKARRVGGEGQDTREYGRRFRGVKAGFPELRRVPQSPAVLARAIERGKGKVFRQLHAAVRHFYYDQVPPAYRRESRVERPTVRAHRALTAKCKRCGVAHGKGEHRFHGKGALLRTHLFPYKTNPGVKSSKSRTRARFARRIAKAGGFLAYASQRYAKKLRGKKAKGKKTQKELARIRRRRNPPSSVVIYHRLLRIEAQKGPGHRCDPGCRKANHCYFHDFGPGAVIYGNPDGTLTIKSKAGKRLWNWF